MSEYGILLKARLSRFGIRYLPIRLVAGFGVALCALAFSFSAPAALAQEPGEPRAYVSVGIAGAVPGSARFSDGEDAGHANLYDRPDLFTQGNFAAAPQSLVAAGYRVASRLRTQLELTMGWAHQYRGNANYDRSGALQPSSAEFRGWQLLAIGFYDLPAWRLGGTLRVEPYLGGGAGLTGYRLDDFQQEFPEPENPDGGLRRGPSGEVPYTRLPPGRGRTLTAMLAAGVALPITGRVRVDVGYRYTDAGAVRTHPGNILVVRYGRDGGRRAIGVPINETTADFRMHTLLATLRVGL